jgi:peptidoglycan glycosyltransferase
MRLILKRAIALLVLISLLVCGLMFFLTKYFFNAPKWASHPANKHLYKNGRIISSGSIFDRSGKMLFMMDGGIARYNDNKTIRTAVMHAVGDMEGYVATGARTVFKDKLMGWNFINGAYHFDKSDFGSDITLTLDSDLCAVAYNALSGRKGTVGVYNYKSGEIICMVSSPSYDPQNPPNVKDNPEKYEGVYMNRFLSSAYTPGSIFKLVTAAAAIDTLDEAESRVYRCDGKKVIDGKAVTCLSAHGDVTLEKALAESCNIAFAEISLELGAEKLQEYANLTGFNSSLKVDGINTSKGTVDLTKADGGDLAWAGIGQYTNTANPLNFMVYMGAIANDGIAVRPRILAGSGIFAEASAVSGKNDRILEEDTARALGSMMRNNVLSKYGEKNFKNLEMCAKTGTAEVGEGIRPHAWFAGFLDREDAPYAFVVIVENGGSGSQVAGAVAAKVLKAAVE